MQGNIEFRNVHFSYPLRQDIPIFKGLDLQIPAGQLTAVVGPSGSGKSSICGLLLRYYDPDAGTVFCSDVVIMMMKMMMMMMFKLCYLKRERFMVVKR